MRPHADAVTAEKPQVSTSESARVGFVTAVLERFAFLDLLGFSRVEVSPTIVRYRKGDVEVGVYHGRRSYELGFEVSRRGDRYSMSELIRLADPLAADGYRNAVASTPEGLAEGLARLEQLAKCHAEQALRGDPEFFSALESQRRSWTDEYSLDVLAGKLRPQADAAFRSGDYREAADLYERIRPRLSATELRKLTLARERARHS